MTGLSPVEATARYSLATSTDYRLLGSLVGGETGATAIEGPDGARRVLKWEFDPSRQARRSEAMVLAERLRVEAAWPVPRQEAILADGWLFVSQEFLPGETVTHLPHGLVDELLRLHERRLQLAAIDGDDSWGEDMIETLVTGGQGYCLHEPLRQHDARTRRIVEQIEEIGRSLVPADLPGRDIVHADLHPGNLLHRDGQLSAVIDLDFAQIGDAAFDVVCLAIASLGGATEPGVQQRLFEEGVERLGSKQRAAYISHLLLRVLDWPIRKRRWDEVEFWVEHADRLLAESASDL